MIGERTTANAVGGKTARACDSCVRKRARWYCAADDAFLCQSCDSSVHSANQLAGRHERVRLETASFKVFGSGVNSEPAWHQGFTRKARTPRARTKSMRGERNVNSCVPLVPEIGVEDSSSLDDGEEEQLLYRVPVFDPFAAELRHASDEMEKGEMFVIENKQDEGCPLDDLQGFELLPDDVELLEFAADVESLLGKGCDEDSRGIEGLEFEDGKREDDIGEVENRVKIEDEEVEAILGDMTTKETLDWDFDYESAMTILEEDEEEEKKVMIGEVTEPMMMVMMATKGECKEEEEGMMMNGTSRIPLRLNYEEVINAWADQGSPWTTGSRPEFNPDESWLDFMGMGSKGCDSLYGGIGGGKDSGREARVSRYREKRRTRLFSKKIRYEVRKLNAEKRPRMKGRFVKRSSLGLGGSSF